MTTTPNKRTKAFKIYKISPYLLALLIGGLLSFHLTEHYYTSPPSNKIPRGEKEAVKLFFSPNGGCAQHIIDTINQAEKEIYIAIYSFTQPSIANALVAAKKRGVDIHILANNPGNHSQLPYLKKEHKMDIYIDSRPRAFHHKWLAVDKKILITGSYNYSKNAEKKNNEIIGHIESPAVVEKYYQDWKRHIKAPKVYHYADL